MQCKKCGSNIGSNYKYCVYCGSRIISNEANDLSYRSKEFRGDKLNPKTNTISNSPCWTHYIGYIIGIAIVLVIISINAIVNIMSSEKEDNIIYGWNDSSTAELYVEPTLFPELRYGMSYSDIKNLNSKYRNMKQDDFIQVLYKTNTRELKLYDGVCEIELHIWSEYDAIEYNQQVGLNNLMIRFSSTENIDMLKRINSNRIIMADENIINRVIKYFNSIYGQYDIEETYSKAAGDEGMVSAVSYVWYSEYSKIYLYLSLKRGRSLSGGLLLPPWLIIERRL